MDGEVKLAQSVYGDHIDYSKVTITKTSNKMPIAAAMVLGSNTFYSEDYYEDDFSRSNIVVQKLFIHEMCHVWQNQTIPEKRQVRDFFRLQFQTGFNYNAAYGYQDGEEYIAFEDLNYERQARLVECFYFAREELERGVGNIDSYNYLRSKVPDFIANTGFDYLAE